MTELVLNAPAVNTRNGISHNGHHAVLDDAQIENDFGLRGSWRLAGTRLAGTPQDRRQAFLSQFAHASVAPGGIEQMTRVELEDKFGQTTIRRYVDDERQRRSPSFDPEAYNFLKYIRDLRNSASQIAHHVRLTSVASGQTDDGLIETWRHFPDRNTLEKFDSLITQTDTYLARASALDLNPTARGGLTKIGDCLKAFREKNDETWGVVKGLYADDKGVKDGFGSALKSNWQQAIIDVEDRFNQTRPQQNQREAYADWHLDNVKALAGLGIFCTDDLLHLAVGEPSFAEDLSKKITKSITQNKGKRRDSYHAFYGRFEKVLPGFIAETLGQTLFAFDDLTPVEKWSRQHIEQLKKFTESRYHILHDVFEGLADKIRNPLCGPLNEAEVGAFAHETLRSSLYPGYGLEIRVGIGGTKQEDPLLRACSYVLPALDIMQSFDAANTAACEAGVSGISVPTLVIVDGSALAVAVNGINPEAASQNGRKFLRFLKEFAGEFYPNIASLVTLHHPDHAQVFDNTIYPLLYRTARELLETGIGEVQKAFTALTRQATHYGSENGGADQAIDKAIQYAAAHAAPDVLGTISRGTARPVIKIGGSGERNFDAIQRAVTEAIFTKPDVPAEIGFPHAIGQKIGALFITVPVGGNPPPYYHSGSSADIGIAEAKDLIGDGVDLQTRFCGNDGAAQDMQALLNHPKVGGCKRFSDFVAKCIL